MSLRIARSFSASCSALAFLLVGCGVDTPPSDHLPIESRYEVEDYQLWNIVESPIQGVTGTRIDELKPSFYPTFVIDVSDKAARSGYRISVDDIEAWEAEHAEFLMRSKIGLRDSMVFLRTGWRDGRREGSAPTLGAEAARMLIEERGVALIGIDAPVTDSVLGGADIPTVQNLLQLDGLPPIGAMVSIGRFEGPDGSESSPSGSGPVKVLAMVPPRGRVGFPRDVTPRAAAR